MKLLKRFFSFFLICFLSFHSISCSDCNNENPRARVTNTGDSEISVQINTAIGSRENIDIIEPGKSSEFRSYDTGNVIFNIVINDNEQIIETVEMDFCSEYEIIVDEDSIVTISTGIE
ncbi:hypothetical protein [uncultured Tenacibaculum sp.]|uniref:hypothetical protein n=1 Tax=uncultured Tenacibaculum sp. TaxID=174713 RepID=UPI002629A673|nr:hypothetical protein [uncultured Tenacibaculum sp.]